MSANMTRLRDDGKGWFNMTGGEVYTKRVMLNERVGSSGYDLGRLTVAGGTLNVGSLTGSDVALSNGICADASAAYLVELGGAGGTIRAVTNLWFPVSATLYGSGTNANTLDAAEWTISMTNRLSGQRPQQNRTGTLLLSGDNVFHRPDAGRRGTLLLARPRRCPTWCRWPCAQMPGDLGGFSAKVGSLSAAARQQRRSHRRGAIMPARRRGRADARAGNPHRRHAGDEIARTRM
jgi:hypothetical protein